MGVFFHVMNLFINSVLLIYIHRKGQLVTDEEEAGA